MKFIDLTNKKIEKFIKQKEEVGETDG